MKVPLASGSTFIFEKVIFEILLKSIFETG